MNIEVLVELQTPNFLIEVSKGIQGTNGVGVPIGGTTSQVLSKKSNTDYDTEWVNQSGGGGAVDSVNGQTGIVVLDAADVGADPAGSASSAISSHVADLDPHTQYATGTELSSGLSGKENTGVAAGLLSAHELASDPHPQYATASEAAAAAPVQSVAGKTGSVSLVKGDVGLGNVDNTSDLDKPISNATQNALDSKEDAGAAAAVQSNLSSHVSNTLNPHSVTKAQVD